MATTFILVCKVTGFISRIASKIFSCSDRSVVHASHLLPNSPTNLITTIVVVTKEPLATFQHMKGLVPVWHIEFEHKWM